MGSLEVVVRWNSKEVLPELEKDIRELFTKYGLEFTGSGSDLVSDRRSLTFESDYRKGGDAGRDLS